VRSAVSQHLSVLREARLVTDRPEKTKRIHRLDPNSIGAMREWLDAQWASALKDFQEFVDQQTNQEGDFYA
jgi:DNA-binding transcriptional ArsR family regulator